MDGSRLNKIALTLPYRNLVQNLRQSAVLDPLPYLFLVCVFGKSTVEIGVRLTVHYIPKFIFAVFVFFLKRVIIPWMYLNGQALMGVDKLDQQRKPLIGFTFPAQDTAANRSIYSPNMSPLLFPVATTL